MLDKFLYTKHADSFASFDDGAHGFGPFVAQRKQLREEILSSISPKTSLHVSGCRGSGKTTLLKLIAKDLADKGHVVYFFRTAMDLDGVRWDIKTLVESGRTAYVLVDETQDNPQGASFHDLLKPTDPGQKVTTIGAGVPKFESMSSYFQEVLTTDRLFLTDAELSSEGVIGYFAGDVDDATEIEQLLGNIREYVGGHVYPLMRLSELLVDKLKRESLTASQTFAYLRSAAFRNSDHFKRLSRRIFPNMDGVNFKAIFSAPSMSQELRELQKRGFCDGKGNVVSLLLMDIYLREAPSEALFELPGKLTVGVDGVKELLMGVVPKMRWEHYDTRGGVGAIENAMTFELLRELPRQPDVEVQFNPRLRVMGATTKFPDVYFNGAVNCYVECVLTLDQTKKCTESLEEHIGRFIDEGDTLKHYDIEAAEWAVLNFQKSGTTPIVPRSKPCLDHFEHRVFTILMATKKLYRGSAMLLNFGSGMYE